MESLKGQLLISSGGLYDPDFRHTVVLVGEHDASGAVGVVLNRALDVAVEEAIPPLGALVDPREPVFSGGPVRDDQAVLLVETSLPGLVDVPVFGSVGFLTGEVRGEVREHILRARVFVGHAGWGSGQLESEFEAGSWILEDAGAEDVFTDAPDALWAAILRRKGPEYEALSRVPFDPSMN